MAITGTGNRRKTRIILRYREAGTHCRISYIIPLIEKLLNDHPDSYAGAFVLAGSGRQVSSIEKKEKLLGMLSAKMKRSDAAQKFADHIQGLKNSGIGKTVANFVLPDPEGKDFALDQLERKICTDRFLGKLVCALPEIISSHARSVCYL